MSRAARERGRGGLGHLEDVAKRGAGDALEAVVRTHAEAVQQRHGLLLHRGQSPAAVAHRGVANCRRREGGEERWQMECKKSRARRLERLRDRQRMCPRQRNLLRPRTWRVDGSWSFASSSSA